jgi:hypothetical protein
MLGPVTLVAPLAAAYAVGPTVLAVAKVSRRQVDHRSAQRPFQTARFDRGPDPVPGVLHGGAGQAGQGERRQPATDVGLDRDEMSADAETVTRSHVPGHTYVTGISRQPLGLIAS